MASIPRWRTNPIPGRNRNSTTWRSGQPHRCDFVALQAGSSGPWHSLNQAAILSAADFAHSCSRSRFPIHSVKNAPDALAVLGPSFDRLHTTGQAKRREGRGKPFGRSPTRTGDQAHAARLEQFCQQAGYQGHQPALVENIRAQDHGVGLVGKVAPVQQTGRVRGRIEAVLVGTSSDEVQGGTIVIGEADRKTSVQRDQPGQADAAADLERPERWNRFLAHRPRLACHDLGQEERTGPEVSPVGHVIVALVPLPDQRIVEQPVRVGGTDHADGAAAEFQPRDRDWPCVLGLPLLEVVRLGLELLSQGQLLEAEDGRPQYRPPACCISLHHTSTSGTKRRKCSLRVSASRAGSVKSWSGLVFIAKAVASWPRLTRIKPTGTTRNRLSEPPSARPSTAASPGPIGSGVTTRPVKPIASPFHGGNRPLAAMARRVNSRE